MMKNNIIVICAVLLLTSCTAQKNKIVINVQIKDYQKYASSYIDKKYTEASKIADSILTKYEESLVTNNYKRAQLKAYTCPVFSFKKEAINYDTITNIIDAIDFTNQYENQVINLYKGNTLISTHSVNAAYETPKEWNNPLNEFTFFENALLLHKNEIITGLPAEYTDVYAYKAQLEKKYLVFFIDGLDTYFVYKDEAIYAVKMICDEKGNDEKTFEEFFACLQPEFIEINTYFKQVDIALINNTTIVKQIEAFQKKSKIKQKKVVIQIDK